MEEYTLVASSTRGHFALDDPQYGGDLSSGQGLEIFVGGQWISGHVEHMTECYPGQMLTQLFEKPSGPDVVAGYYFMSEDGSIVGLCVGMKVRL